MARGISLHLGLNHLDPNHYGGWDGKLNGCEYDAEDLKYLAVEQRFSVYDVFKSEDAIKEKFTSALQDISKQLTTGDIFLLTFSGHGDQLKDLNNDELDGLDETWCLYDYEIIDDEIHQLLSLFRAGVRILILSDSCHSGTVFKLASHTSLNDNQNTNTTGTIKCVPKHISGKIYRQNREYYDRILKDDSLKESRKKIQASVRLISACQDNQVAIDLSSNGLFTSTLLDVWDDGWFKGNYRSFYNNIVRKMPLSQTPKHSLIGPVLPEYNNQKPFKI